jgi:hypothetical protein
MYGYQPPAARRLAQTPEQYADGGLVARMKSADAGPAAFGSRGLSQLRDMVPKMAAMGYPQQAQAPSPVPAAPPATNPRAAQLQAMIPQMEDMGYQQKPLTPQMLARGGMVRGPGTGTSDSIATEAEPGTYIMPADSTAAIGPSALEKMGTVPVRLSDGEFKIPPEQVMALGAAVLKLYKDATHTPVNGEDGGQTDAEVEDDDKEGARGFNPADRMAEMPQMFADGGMVDPNRPRSFGDAAAAAQDPGVTQIGAGYQPANGTMSVVPAPPRPALGVTTAPAQPPSTPVNVANPAWQRMAAAPSPAAPAPAPMGWQARQDQRSLEVTASSIMDSPERRAAQQRLGTMPAAGFQPRRYADGGMVEDDMQKRLANQTAMYVRGAQEAAATAQAAPNTPVSAPTQPAGALTRAASISTPAPAVQAMGTLPNNAVTRTGNSYTGADNISGDITVNGQAPGGGAISAQNMGAADSLAGRQSQESLARVLGQMPSVAQGVQVPTIRTSANDWQTRKDLENAATSAASITSNGGRFDQTGGKNPAALAYRAALETDNALRASAPGLAQQAMREQGDTQRAGLQVTASGLNAAADRQSALERTLIGERGANARAGLSAAATLDAAKVRAGAGANKPLNDVQSKALQFGTRMQAAGSVLDGLASKGVDQPGLIKRAADAVGIGGAANWTQSGEQQQVEQAQRDFINAVLRRESGAAIADSEFSNARQQYFPQVGDSPEVIAQKRKNREIATAGVLAEVPDSETRVNQVMKTANGNSPAPQGLPSGMSRQVGTSGGRPVYEDAQGNRFIGG